MQIDRFPIVSQFCFTMGRLARDAMLMGSNTFNITLVMKLNINLNQKLEDVQKEGKGLMWLARTHQDRVQKHWGRIVFRAPFFCFSYRGSLIPYSRSSLANLGQAVFSVKLSYPLVELMYYSSLHFNKISVGNMELGEHNKVTAAVDETG